MCVKTCPTDYWVWFTEFTRESLSSNTDGRQNMICKHKTNPTTSSKVPWRPDLWRWNLFDTTDSSLGSSLTPFTDFRLVHRQHVCFRPCDLWLIGRIYELKIRQNPLLLILKSSSVHMFCSYCSIFNSVTLLCNRKIFHMVLLGDANNDRFV